MGAEMSNPYDVEDPVADAAANWVTFSESQVGFLHHHIANSLVPLQVILETGAVSGDERKWLEGSVNRLKSLLKAVKCSRLS